MTSNKLINYPLRDNSGNEMKKHSTLPGGKDLDGKATTYIICPFCEAQVMVGVWPVPGGATRRCICGVLHSLSGFSHDDKNIYGNGKQTTMLVKDLVSKLLKFDQDLRVVTPGFDETEPEDIGEPEIIQVIIEDHNPSHMVLKYNQVKEYNDEEKRSKGKDVLMINF